MPVTASSHPPKPSSISPEIGGRPEPLLLSHCNHKDGGFQTCRGRSHVDNISLAWSCVRGSGVAKKHR